VHRGFNNLTLPIKAKADLVSANESDASSNHNENSFVAFRRHRFEVLTFRTVDIWYHTVPQYASTLQTRSYWPNFKR
jgi:hypothetical protein